MKVLHLTEEEATQIVVEISKLLRHPVKIHQTPHWSLVKQIQEAFGLVWREDKRMFMRE
jgi:hypothetical protein